MKQRSAMVVAAGLVLALALAGFGLAMGMTGPSADAKAPRVHRKPVVHTTTRTVTVHKPGTSADAFTSSDTTPATQTSTAPAGSYETGSTSDDSYEHESESSDSGSEDMSGSSFEGGDD